MAAVVGTVVGKVSLSRQMRHVVNGSKMWELAIDESVNS